MAKKKAKPEDDDQPKEGEKVKSSAPKPAPAPAGSSLPGKAAFFTFVFLIVLVIVTVVIYWWDPASRLQWNWWHIISLILLVVVIPIVVHRAVTLWLLGVASRYPDVNYAWNAGIAALRENGMDLQSAPLFLIFGTGNDKLRRNLMTAANMNFRVNGVPKGLAALHWYANPRGIYLFLDEVTWMNGAAALYEHWANEAKAGHGGPGGKAAAAPIIGTINPGSYRPANPQPSAAGGDRQSAAPAENAPQEAKPVSSRQMMTQTIIPGDVIKAETKPDTKADSGQRPGKSPASPGTRAVPNRLPAEVAANQLRKLQTVCTLIRRRRHPVCPVNGVLSLLPFDMLQAGDDDVAELERAIAADLATAQRELQLRCPVTLVVVGMEQDRGFRELIRRIGLERARAQRFGQRFDLRVLATVDELEKLAAHVCGTFEDWVYTLFRDEDALRHPGNNSLYALLCKVRRSVKARLGNVLGKGFGCDPQAPAGKSLLFSGCYFTATGPKADRQAFVNGILSKLREEQEYIEWTPEALNEDRRRGWTAFFGWVTALVLLAVVIVLAVMRLNAG